MTWWRIRISSLLHHEEEDVTARVLDEALRLFLVLAVAVLRRVEVVGGGSATWQFGNGVERGPQFGGVVVVWCGVCGVVCGVCVVCVADGASGRRRFDRDDSLLRSDRDSNNNNNTGRRRHRVIVEVGGGAGGLGARHQVGGGRRRHLVVRLSPLNNDE